MLLLAPGSPEEVYVLDVHFSFFSLTVVFLVSLNSVKTTPLYEGVPFNIAPKGAFHSPSVRI